MGAVEQGNSAADRPYSKAFELLVGDNTHDLVGLLAYARYKQMIRDQVKQGVLPSGSLKNLSDQQAEVFRGWAQRELAEFASVAIDDAREEIQVSSVLLELGRTKAELTSAITRATGTGRAIVTNVIGWLVSIFITVLVVFALNSPTIIDLFKWSSDPEVQAEN